MSKSTAQSTTAGKIWRPHPGPQEEAFRYFWCFEILYGGAKGGGKTDWLLFDFLDPVLLKKSHYRGIIFRRTYPRLREIIDRSFQWFTTIADYSKNERCWTFASGAKLFFAHCQYEESKYDYQGHEYHYMGFDQVEEFTLSQYDFLKIQCRTTDKDMPVRIRATANPGNVGHLWVKTRFVDGKEPMKVYRDKLGLTRMYIPAKVYDNPSLIENDPLYVKRLESLPEQERKALLEGDWNIFAGQYFAEWRPGIHVIEPTYTPVSWKKFVAGDYGHKKPSSVGWYAIDPDGNVIRYRELYQEGLSYEELGQKICEMSGDEVIDYGVFDPAIFGDKQHHSKHVDAREGKSGAEVMQETISKYYEDIGRPNDSFLITRGDNRRIEGWRTVKSWLKVEDEQSRFKVTSNCVNFIKTFPANVHDERKVEDLNTDGEDHSADECRYALMSRPPETILTSHEHVEPNSPWAKMQELKRRRENA